MSAAAATLEQQADQARTQEGRARLRDDAYVARAYLRAQDPVIRRYRRLVTQ